ncbi:MAG: hypothetical protein FWH52_02475 [Synergistaceae bacterium]|nr:hypothetical protein [Synergistaceae bacterium]
MKGIAIAILIVLLLGVVIQPLIETSNVLKEKVTLGAAILSSCRAARGNALMDERMRDLNANIDEDIFKHYFAEAFSETLGVYLSSPSGLHGRMEFTSPSGRWDQITVDLTLQSPHEIYFSGHEVIQAEIYLSTPYVFRTPLLRDAAALLPNSFEITETRNFEAQIIN